MQETAVGRSVITEEDDVLPFPDAGLPSDVMTDSVPDSAHTQRGPGIMSKMKSLAKQVVWVSLVTCVINGVCREDRTWVWSQRLCRSYSSQSRR